MRRLGYTADVVANGLEVLATLEQIPYDVILMDCQMPEMDGYEATRRIRQGEKEKRLPPLRIVAMTANAMEGDREKCLAAGMNDYITKPVRVQELEAVLEHSAPVRLPLPSLPGRHQITNAGVTVDIQCQSAGAATSALDNLVTTTLADVSPDRCRRSSISSGAVRSCHCAGSMPPPFT